VARFQGEDDLITRLRNTADTDYDLVIVFAGINDSLRANNISVGFGMDENGNKETDVTKYFVPAVDTFFAELTEKFVDARICVVLPLRTRYKYAGHNSSSPGTLYDGSTSRLETDYADYIAKVAEEYCLPVLDATRHSGFAPFNSVFAERWVNKAERGNGDTTLVPDGVHPNEEYCYKYLSKYIRGFIDGLI
jgi:lysophospholipase L1-like esterase